MQKDAPIIPFGAISEKTLPSGKRTLVGGCFDVLHIGHINFLKAAKEEGGKVIVALESDEFIKKRKKREPFHSQAERANILAAIRFVDLVILLPFFQSDVEYMNLVETISPAIIAVTAGDTQLENKKKQAEKIGGGVKIVIPHQKSTSSTTMIEFFSRDT